MENVKKYAKKIFENKKLFVGICVFVLTCLTIGVSYSAFFTVKSNSGNQTVNTGTLAVSYSGSETALIKTDMQPISDSDGMSQSENRVIYIQNTGSIDASYVLTIGYDMTSFVARDDYDASDKLTPVEYIKMAVYEYDSSTQTSTLVAGPLSMGDLPIYEINTDDYRYNRYGIILGSIGNINSGDATKTYQIKVWLSDKATPVASQTYFYINTEILATAKEAMMNYNLSGTLVDENGSALSGATVSLQNGSIVSTTDSSGAFSFSNVPVGTYNLKVNDTYECNITVKEGTTIVLRDLGSTFSAVTSSNIFNTAYTYGTTPNKLIKINSFTEISNNITFNSGTTYNIYPSYILTGGTEIDISNLTIKTNSVNNVLNISI